MTATTTAISDPRKDQVTIVPGDSSLKCPIQAIPKEILLHILSFLPELNIIPRIESTCKLFKMLSEKELLWKQRFTLRFSSESICQSKDIKQQVQELEELQRQRLRIKEMGEYVSSLIEKTPRLDSLGCGIGSYL